MVVIEDVHDVSGVGVRSDQKLSTRFRHIDLRILNRSLEFIPELEEILFWDIRKDIKR